MTQMVYLLKVSLLLLSCKIGGTLGLTPLKFVVLGGTGRIGSAVASHLLEQSPDAQILLVGRSETRGLAAVEEVLSERPGKDVKFAYLSDVWQSRDQLASLLDDADCLIHTAGPYLGQKPIPLEVAIESGCRAYVDVSDPLDYLEASLDLTNKAKEAGTSALVASGAFPGMSNVLAVEAVSQLEEQVKDVRFNYFTAGLGGSGKINLYITNLGFGEPMAQFDGGKLRFFETLSGMLLGKVDFFLNSDAGFGNEIAKERVGTKTVFAWPFPEAATVAKEMGATGDSSAAMGTAPDIWNDMLGLLVSLVPRPLWRSERFSQFLADFSEPLVQATDTLLRLQSPDGVGETHAMRIDVTGVEGNSVSIVQGHESFRRCVGQSCAEFALDLLEHPSSGVQLPEQRYRDASSRRRIVKKLTSTPGTFCYTGAVLSNSRAPPPCDIEKALEKANRAKV